MSVQILNNTDSNSRIIFAKRFSSGVPWVLQRTGATSCAIYKGNSATPTSFSSIISLVPADILCCTQVSGTEIGILSKAVSGMNDILELKRYNESGSNTFTTTVHTFNQLPSSSELRAFIHVDTNGDYHITFSDRNTNMGTSYVGLYYTNNIGGSFKTPVEIVGATTSTSTSDFQSAIDGNNICFIGAYTSLGGTPDNVFRGDAVNATSFSYKDLVNTTATFKNGVFVDSNGHHYVLLCNGTNKEMTVCKHLVTDTSWTTISETLFTAFDYDGFLGARNVGETLYFFYADTSGATPLLRVQEIDLNGTGTPTQISADNGSFPYDIASVVNPYNWISSWCDPHPTVHSYGSDGTDYGVGGTRPEIDFVYVVADGANYDTFWVSYSFAAATNVSKIKVSSWKDWAGAQINIGGTWKTVTAVKINIGGVWKDADITP